VPVRVVLVSSFEGSLEVVGHRQPQPAGSPALVSPQQLLFADGSQQAAA
jgi:hypothetical protein